MTHEKRTHAGAVEVRKRDDALPTLRGYAAVFGKETVIGGYFRELIEPGAFDWALSRPDDVRAQFNHDSNFVLGRTAAGTLRLAVDDVGLAYEIDLPETTYARDLAASVERGDVSQSSFMFEIVSESWDYPPRSSGELPLRRILDVKLYDVAPVTFPAYAETTVSARAMQQATERASDTVPQQDATLALALLDLDEMQE